MCRKQTERGKKYEKINNYSMAFGKYTDDCGRRGLLLSAR